MNDYFKRLTNLLFLLLAILILILGVTQFGRRIAVGAFSPFLSAWEWCTRRVAGVSNKLFDTEKERMDAERAALLSELLAQKRGVDELAEENRQLRRQLSMEPPVGWRGVYAPVILRDPVTWNWEFIISKGSDDGIKVGNLALFGDVAIGRVTEVFHKTAKVSTLASPVCKFSVFVVAANGEEYPGILQGQGAANGGDPPECTVDYLPKMAEIAEADAVVTSGLGGAMPYRIPVGKLRAAPQLVDNARLRVQVGPLADFRKIHYITLLVEGD